MKVTLYSLVLTFYVYQPTYASLWCNLENQVRYIYIIYNFSYFYITPFLIL